MPPEVPGRSGLSSRNITGVGLRFPRADWPIAVEYTRYRVIRLRRIQGIEFVEETVAALGSSTEADPVLP
jgi:hypothetical protein